MNAWIILSLAICALSNVQAEQTDAQFQQEVLRIHNKYRAHHDTEPMTLNPKMCKEAKAYAEILAQEGQLRHSNHQRHGDGENLAMVRGFDMTGEYVTDMWYVEVCDYNFDTGEIKIESRGGFISHFAQVVWKSSTQLGIGKFKVGSETYAVVRYRKPGNYVGQFQQNVQQGQFKASECPALKKKVDIFGLKKNHVHKNIRQKVL
uniref:Toxin candidate TRINITY_DN30054_c0_g1_i2 n=1 Tax=Pachycerianthus borealis TaxID=2736680 RepID=A0A7G7WYY3_9CNID|nr:toxin candidate TRINITY_DN30054_c0_g1_i2 [Pachycerianthus borealis]